VANSTLSFQVGLDADSALAAQLYTLTLASNHSEQEVFAGAYLQLLGVDMGTVSRIILATGVFVERVLVQGVYMSAISVNVEFQVIARILTYSVRSVGELLVSQVHPFFFPRTPHYTGQVATCVRKCVVVRTVAD
jgi:hypothetical protein